MKHLKSVIIVLIILIIIVTGICIVVLKNSDSTPDNTSENQNNIYNESLSNENETKEDNEDNSEGQEFEKDDDVLYSDTRIKSIESDSMLLTIQSCINSYCEYSYSEDREAVFNLLDDEYISKNNITKDNVFGKVEKLEQSSKIFVGKAYEKEVTFGYEHKYFIYGIYYNSKYENLGERYFEINLDTVNFTFKLIPHGEITEEGYNKKMEELIANDTGKVAIPKDIEATSIAKNNYNKYEIRGTSGLNNLMMNYYFDYYRFLMMNNSKKAYELLDESYKNNNFSSYSSFEQYCKNKLSEVTDASIVESKSKIEYLKGYKRFTIIDNYGNRYIFDVKQTLDFAVSLAS